uniref:hypothetical protein n=1 Tax=Ningiella ruwaisensis TaxID=2364274 RepID=UPI0010A0531F|nr:hypothetical protein [Ningiella ruwaisensis]
MGGNTGSIANDMFNRVISYARNVKGQFWLSEHKYDVKRLGSFSAQHPAKAKIDSGNWFSWVPSNTTQIDCHLPPEGAAIKESEWEDLQTFLQESKRPQLAFELLSNARQLLEIGKTRGSLIDAITALEISLNRFGKDTDIASLKLDSCSDRVNFSRIGSQIKHLGFSGSVSFLLPLLFPESVLQKQLISSCWDAIQKRNNVVHQGQREMKPEYMHETLRNIEDLCRILDSYTKK